MTFFLGGEALKGKYPGLRAGMPLRRVNINLNDLHSLHIVGSPGEGKSTLLGRLADACIANGEGVVLIDPKGDLAEELAQRTYHQDRLVYVAPGLNRDWSLNVLEAPKDQREIVAGSILELFAFLGKYDSSFMTLVGQYLTAATQLAFTDDQPTLIDVICLLIDEEYRKQVVVETRRPDLKLFWDAFDRRTPTDRVHQTDSTKARLWEFLHNTATFHFISQYESTLTLTKWLNEGKLVVINLGENLPYGDTVRIGNLIITYLTIQHRLRDSTDGLRRWRLIVDEFHEFAPRTFTKIIRNKRSSNVFVAVAHQDMGQLENQDYLIDALGHSTRISLRGSMSDLSEGSQKAISRRRHQAELRMRSLRDTSVKEVVLAQWDAPYHGLAEPEVISRPPVSLWPRYERFVAGKISGHAKTTRKSAFSRTAKDVPHEPDPAWSGSDEDARPSGLLDLIARSQDVLLGGSELEGPDTETIDGPQRRQ